ncbi:MAG: DUF362 domain-containing protein [Anaerolineales bacterium]|nr:DUF362 domain-containing protein [Anaerolineales bacterium]
MDRRAFIKATLGLSGASLSATLLHACKRFSSLTPTATQLAQSTTQVPRPTFTHTPTTVISPSLTPTKEVPMAQIALVKTEDRTEGVKRALAMLAPDVKEKKILIKPNFNSSHPTPGSTHNDVLGTLIQWSQEHGADRISVGDRSGMETTRNVMEEKGIYALGEDMNFQVIDFDSLEADQWEVIQFEGCNWSRGIPIARPVLDADGVISTCCLKTHRYGGHFTMSLKNSVGIVARTIPGDAHRYMSELHESPKQREMIAEINLAYQPDIVVLDAIDAFANEGPESGKLVHPGVILVGKDRVAIDAVGVAILRNFGSTREVMRGSIFDQDQIARAVELGLGVEGPEKIEFLFDDPESEAFAHKIRSGLNRG